MKKRRRRRLSFRRRRTLGEFTLRPQRQTRRRSAVQRNLSRALVPALIAVMIVSLFMIACICRRSMRTKKLNEELSALHAGQTTAAPYVPAQE